MPAESALFFRGLPLGQFINALPRMLGVGAVGKNFQILFVVADGLSIVVLFLISLAQQNPRPRKIVFIMNSVLVSLNSRIQIALALIIEPDFNVLVGFIGIVDFRFFG